MYRHRSRVSTLSQQCKRVDHVIVVFLVLCLAAVSAIEKGSQKQSAPLPTELYQSIMGFAREAVNMAMMEFKHMLKDESRHAKDMRHRPDYANRRNSFQFVQSFMGLTPQGKQLSYPSFIQAKALGILRHRFSLTNEQTKSLLSIMPKMLQPSYETPSNTPPTRLHALQCPYPTDVVCDPYAKYRTYDGRCNNLQRPLWGSSHQPLVRFVPPNYADALSKPRESVTGRYLPSARLVSAVIHWDIDMPHHLHTLMLMQFGQFLDHDLSRTAISKMTVTKDGMSDELEDVECGQDGCVTSGRENHACFPIEIPRNDTDYKRSRRCLMFVRSQEVPNAECSPGPREQLNQLTSYIDASLIYGSTTKEALDLRDIKPDRGQLKTTKHPRGSYKSLLPYNRMLKDCRGDNRTILCFKAGDGRVNEFSGITTMHIVWVREHNQIEQRFHEMNPHWDGERLYQETRRLITALWQHSTYFEYLPLILGRKAMDAHGLTLVNKGYWNGYDYAIDPGVANSFATAAMRFGHTQLQGLMQGRDTNYNAISTIPLSTQLRRPHLMYEIPREGTDMMLLGLIGDSTQQRDQFITKQVTRHLFSEKPPNALGEDLMSLNMQRGRDHGLPGYNAFREWCGMTKVYSFDDLLSDLPVDVVNRFKTLYAHVDDIDLWPAGVSELSKGSAFLGPTFTCILSRQFHNLKFGDRFWFEDNVHNPYPFTPAQLAEIRKFRYSKIVCDNADYLPHIQPFVFLHPMSAVRELSRLQNRPPDIAELEYFYDSTSGNERVPCSSLPAIDLEAWRESPPPPPPPPPPPAHPPIYHAPPAHHVPPSLSRRRSGRSRRRRHS